MVTQLTWTGVNARRLERHGLARPWTGAGPGRVAGAICGAHAQIAAAGEVSLALRIEGARRTDVQHALLVERSLVRTYGPRGTVHLLPAGELALWLGALGAVPLAQGEVAAQLRYTPDETDELVAAIGDALAEAELTADELTTVLVDTVGAWAAEPATEAFQQRIPRWRLLTHTAAYRGALCFGPNRGRRATYTSPSRSVPGLVPAPARQAVGEVVLRYLHAYGPATPQQLARWLAAPIGWVREHVTTLGGRIEEVSLEGEPAWVVAGDTLVPQDPPRGLRLLPYFDAFGVGSHPRARLFPGRAAQRALAGGQAGNYPLLLVDGEVAGVWHQRRAGRRLHVTVEPLASLTAPRRRELDTEVERLAAVQDATPELVVGEVQVGPHA